MHETREDENIYQVFWAWSRLKNMWVRRFESEKEFWVEREFSIKREVRKWIWFRAPYINRNRNSMDRSICRDLSSTNSWQKWIYRGAVKDLSMEKITLMDQTICQESTGQTKSQEIWLDGSKKLSRIYQEVTQKSRWIEIPLRSIKKRKKKGLIKGNLLRICRGAVKLKERRFFKERKNT